MFDLFDFDSANPFKRLRDEERELDNFQARPQGRFATQLVKIYFVRMSKLESENERKSGMEVYSLEDLMPSLAEQVGSVAHHYQLIEEENVPLSFARTNALLKPPKRAFIATVLAILIQTFVFHECGVYISVSKFDAWFNGFSRVGGIPISRCWLDTKAYVAKCIAQKTRIAVFGQETIWKYFNNIQELHCLGDRVLWMILRSANYQHLQLNQNEKLNFVSLVNETSNEEVCNRYCAPKDTFLWRIWYKAFSRLFSCWANPTENKLLTAEKLFVESIENSKCLILNLTRIINGNANNIESTYLFNELYPLCGGTSGEFAAICLFLALKSSLVLHFAGEATTKLGVGFSAEVMLRLFNELIRYYLFLSPSSRHHHLLDICQALWQSPGVSFSKSMFIQSFASQRQKRAPVVYQEDVFKHPTMTTCTLYNEGSEVQSKRFSICILDELRSEEGVKKLVKCLEFQRKNITTVCDVSRGKQAKSHEVSVACSSGKLIKKPFFEENIIDSWCTIELPKESEEESSFIERFLRNDADSLVKKRVHDDMSKLNSAN
ncbi:hypothetical protein TcCL_NonESM05954 [Trypanosoma cruzi]|uniref:Uncharacterized protein n=1 Tax=Trypanosoma cruzi (strain CL Brener) TaxID=353153 RepID=Q4DMK2_TRYCC|nr:hypothetical protein, conserved [Trypanosoma cruzi]EAN93739.1 hypothetical protein, conserved [Trypanosoma cruzi]RNC44362.1 hypothetical protein TcCL_NonESM05954 [Trypanosoma cruzi]|eukprot:XP_815590.1 hypothetical protein [Trypanosoma cruzi strain CL Brener]